MEVWWEAWWFIIDDRRRELLDLLIHDKSVLSNEQASRAKGVNHATLVHTACEYGRSSCLKFLLRHYKMQLHTLEVADSFDVQGYTPLHIAALRGDLNCINILLSASVGADVNKRGYGGMTVIFLLCMAGPQHSKTVRMLLGTNKVNVRLSNAEGSTPLHEAAKHENQALMMILLRYIEQRHSNRSVYRLLKRKNDLGQRPIDVASKGSAKVLQRIMVEGPITKKMRYSKR